MRNPDAALTPPFAPESFATHDNGGRAFRVFMAGPDVTVVRLLEDDGSVKELEHATVFRPVRAFVGHSPKNAMTEFSGGHGPTFRGNSVLFDLGDGLYVHVGASVISFTPEAPIARFSSPVGGSDVPYPYAIDQLGNAYLLIEGAVLDAEHVRERHDVGPYERYYARCLLTADEGCVPPKHPEIAWFDGIERFYIGDELYTLNYVNAEDAGEDYDRLSDPDSFPNDSGNVLSVVTTEGTRYDLDREGYVDLMRRFGETAGFRPMAGLRTLAERAC
jgi:hypothetical protein